MGFIVKPVKAGPAATMNRQLSSGIMVDHHHAPVAQLVEHRAVTREVVTSVRPDQHSGSLNN